VSFSYDERERRTNENIWKQSEEGKRSVMAGLLIYMSWANVIKTYDSQATSFHLSSGLSKETVLRPVRRVPKIFPMMATRTERGGDGAGNRA